MSDSYVELETHGHVALLWLSNPPRHTINAAGSQRLYDMLNELSLEDSVRVVVLTGRSNDIFVRHYEVDELADSSERMVNRPVAETQPKRRTSQGVEGGLRGAMNLLESMNQVTIAAINGMAHGGGLELALACDFRLARAGEFTLGLPETGVGILPGGGGTQRLARLIGVARTLDLILHGTTISPDTALDYGIVSRVLSHELDEYREAAMKFAQTLAARAPIALRNSKKAIREGIELPLAEGLRREAQLFGELMRTQDAAAALRAVTEGRSIPEFKGS